MPGTQREDRGGARHRPGPTPYGARRVGPRRVAIACAAALAAASCLLGFSSCGGVKDDAIVIEVGDLAVSKATVDHWTGVVARGGAFSGFRGAPPRGTPRQRAIALLISSNWLIGEAARQGVAASAATIDQALAEREQSAEFEKRLRATRQTLADVKLELSAELAGEALREKLASRATTYTQRDVVAYYHQNSQLFKSREVRVTDVIEGLPSASAMAALVRRIGTGRGFAIQANHEFVSRDPSLMSTPEKVAFVNAILAARPGVVSRPMKLNRSWAAFVVRKVMPPAAQPLAKVRAEVEARFNATRQREIASRFDNEYRERWGAKTRCHSGYVAPGCPQFTGPLEPYEDPFSSRARPLLSQGALPD